MTKKYIKQVLKIYGFTLIDKSWFQREDKQTALFNAFDCSGVCYVFWVDNECQYATYQRLSDIMLHKQKLITKWFF